MSNDVNNQRTEAETEQLRQRAYKALAAGAVGALFLGPIGAVAASWAVDRFTNEDDN